MVGAMAFPPAHFAAPPPPPPAVLAALPPPPLADTSRPPPPLVCYPPPSLFLPPPSASCGPPLYNLPPPPLASYFGESRREPSPRERDRREPRTRSSPGRISDDRQRQPDRRRRESLDRRRRGSPDQRRRGSPDCRRRKSPDHRRRESPDHRRRESPDRRRRESPDHRRRGSPDCRRRKSPERRRKESSGRRESDRTPLRHDEYGRQSERSSSQRAESGDRYRISRERSYPANVNREKSSYRDRNGERNCSRDRVQYRDRSHNRDKSPENRNSRDSKSESHHRSRSRDRVSSSHRARGEDVSKLSEARQRSNSKQAMSDQSRVLSDREKLLETYRKNYCESSEEIMERIRNRENHSEDEEPQTWYRSSPAELYYHPVDGAGIIKQTTKLAKLCSAFTETLIERGVRARPEVDELPPPKAPKPRLCKHRLEHKLSSSSSSSSDCDDLDEDGLLGVADRFMQELQRKQSHPRRLHPEMWYNSTGEMNGGPLCRCNARAKRQGMRHGVYANEQLFPRCDLYQNNINRLYHYRITVSPATNYLTKTPTIISHDEHEFIFTGFSLFSHYKLADLPKCKVIRFNIEYTILYVQEQAPHNFTIQELEIFEEYLFKELLELVDLDLGKVTEKHCSQFHFMPRFVRSLPEGGCEILSMCEVLKYLLKENEMLIPPDKLKEMHHMDHFTWQKFVDRIKGMIVTCPGKKPCSVRVDQLDRSPPEGSAFSRNKEQFYPEIIHFGIRPPQLSYAGNPEYQKAWRFYVKYKHLIANMSKPLHKDKQKLQTMEDKMLQMRTQSKMKRDVTVAISSEGFYATGLMCDVVQHAMLIPVLVRHLRFHKSVDGLEEKVSYRFKSRYLLQKALTHPSYRENFGMNPDHARNSITNCGIRQPQYGDRKIHYTNTRKKGINTLIDIMSRFGKSNETESAIKHNERLEFLGDAVVEFLSSIHLFRMFPGLAEGGLATYRAAIVQNQHLAVLAKKIDLEKFMLYSHGSDLCRDVVMRHAMANCFEALMGALFLDGGIEVADKVFALSLWYDEPGQLEVWSRERPHPLQEQEPLGDRHHIHRIPFLQKLHKFELSIGVTFKHIRLLARAFTDRSVGYTHLTLGSNQRLEFLGDTVLQLVVSDRLYRHFPEHHEGHLSLLRSSLVNNRTQATICDDLDMSTYALYNNPKAKPTTKKHKADLLEAFLGALYVDKGMMHCITFCNVVLFPRLHVFISNQDWNDPKSKLQQCCLTLRSMEGGEPDIPLYKVIESQGPTNTRVYRVAVYFRGARLAAAHGHSIQEAEMNAASEALVSAHELFPQLKHQKRFITKHNQKNPKNGAPSFRKHSPQPKPTATKTPRRVRDERVPKAYRLGQRDSSSSESDAREVQEPSDEDTDENDGSDNDNDVSMASDKEKSDNDDDGEGSDNENGITVSSWVSDMERLKENLIKENKYHCLRKKAASSGSE